MSEWNRVTRECVYETVPVSIRNGIQNHLETYNLGSITKDYTVCIETRSEKKKKGLFSGGGNKILDVYAVLTPTWLVWATSGDKSGIGVQSVQLKDLQIQDYEDTPAYQMLPDSGIYLTGIFTGLTGTNGNQRVSSFIGLGQETAAKNFKEYLMRAFQISRKY